MDARRCYFPNYRGDYFQPSRSQWPLSHVRSSTRSQDDSSDLDTFEWDWVGGHANPIPHRQRTIRNLTGRTLEESFANLKRKHSSESPPPPPSTSPREPEITRTSGSRHVLKKECPTTDPSSRLGHQELGLTNTDATKQVAARKETNVVDPRDKIEETEQKLGSHAGDATSSPRGLSIPREKTPHIPHKRLNEIPASAHNSGSIVHIQAQDNTASQQSSLSQCTAPPVLSSEQSDDDDDAMNLESSNPNRATKVKKPKQQGSHICKLCDITFTRNFDLLRHNQKHQVETEGDIVRRTCTNCERVLSRVDATKRHVDTLPESCNYLRRKQGLKPLPVMPDEHYVACRAQYHKLAQERKKPKGRKKANPA